MDPAQFGWIHCPLRPEEVYAIRSYTSIPAVSTYPS